MSGFLRTITGYGSAYAESKSDKRNVILANYTSLIGFAALLLLIVALFIFYGYSPGMFSRLAAAAIFFLAPLLLNRLGFIVTSRVLLCWLTPVFVFGISILDLKSGEQMSSSSFVGLRLFLLAGFCFPFLFFNLKDKFLLSLGLAIPIVSIVFFDEIFGLFEVSYLKNAVNDRFYEFSNVRALIAMLAIGLSLFFLKNVVEKNEQLNEDLLLELEGKNKLIQKQAEAEVYELNKELNRNLEKLQISEHRYRSLFEQASDFIAILDFDGNFIDANDSWRTAFGYSKEELSNVKIEDLIDPEELKFRPILYAELQRGEHVFSHRRMMRKDKTIVEVESNVKKLYEGKMLVIARDVTKLREAQHQIQLSEAKFRGAFEFSAIGMALVSTEGNWLKVNKALCTMVGYSEDELLLLNVRDITVPEESNEGYILQQKLLKGERENFQGERRYIHRDGSIIWVNLNISLVKDAAQSPLFFVAQIEDITAQKKAAEKLILNEANLNATINNTELMIWSVDREFKLLMFNEQFAKYMKKHYDLDIQNGSRIFAHIKTPVGVTMTEKWTPLYQRALSGDRITLEETRFGIDFQYSLSPIIENDKVIGVSIFADNVTDRKARDRELAIANKKLSEYRLLALRSAMSPHFIFNVMNSIQYFIAKNDRLNAMNYLSLFSKLIRGILTHSITASVSLSDELDLLKQYIELEMLRFDHKFNYELLVSPEVDLESTMIPSLILQPYVENAIVHGLYNKRDSGSLTLRITQAHDVLQVEIEDDGIGRVAAKELRSQSFPEHKSVGLNITAERLRLIDSGATLEITDLMANNKPAGTRVNLSLKPTWSAPEN